MKGDSDEVLRDLKARRDALVQVIATLEAVQRSMAAREGGGQGRISVDPHKRLGVASRMRHYWATRRAKNRRGL